MALASDSQNFSGDASASEPGAGRSHRKEIIILGCLAVASEVCQSGQVAAWQPDTDTMPRCFSEVLGVPVEKLLKAMSETGPAESETPARKKGRKRKEKWECRPG
jgi:hypothetical protein